MQPLGQDPQCPLCVRPSTWKMSVKIEIERECVKLFSMMCSSSNIGEFSKDVRMLAALEETESDGNKLLDAARRLAGAFSELLSAAQPGSAEVGS